MAATAPDPRLVSQKLKQGALALGFSRAGVCQAGSPETWSFFSEWLEAGHHAGMDYLAKSADLRESLDSILPKVRSVLAVTLNYGRVLTHEPGQPKIARYALGRDYHQIFRKNLARLAKDLQSEFGLGEFRAVSDSAPLLEREWAQRAGMGWPGKNTCLIDSHQGSWTLLGFLLTTLDAEPDSPSKGGCGTCRACLDACPTGAIIHQSGRWQVDSRLCLSYWTIEHKGPIPDEIAAKMNGWTFGCDICQEVCPFNHPRSSQPLRGAPATHPDLTSRNWPSLLELAQISYDEWDRLTQGSPVRRRGWQGLRWNAQACLGQEQPNEASAC